MRRVPGRRTEELIKCLHHAAFPAQLKPCESLLRATIRGHNPTTCRPAGNIGAGSGGSGCSQRPGSQHAFTTATGGRVLFVCSPSGNEEMFLEIGALGTGGTNQAYYRMGPELGSVWREIRGESLTMSEPPAGASTHGRGGEEHRH